MLGVMSAGSLCLQAPSRVGQTVEPPHARLWLFQAAPNQGLIEVDIERQWCFWNVVLEKTRVPWIIRRSNWSIWKEINPDYSLEGLMLKLKLLNFGHLTRRTNSLEKTLMLRKIEGRRIRGCQRTRWLDDIIDSMDMSLTKLWEMVKGKENWSAAVHGVPKNQTQLSDWTTIERLGHFSPIQDGWDRKVSSWGPIKSPEFAVQVYFRDPPFSLQNSPFAP